MKRTLRTGWAVALACLLVGAARGRMVTTGTVVANPGATVSVPVTVDDIADVGAAATRRWWCASAWTRAASSRRTR